MYQLPTTTTTTTTTSSSNIDLVTFLVGNTQITEEQARKTLDILSKEGFELSKKGLHEVLTDVDYQESKEKIFTEDNGWNGKKKGNLIKICRSPGQTSTSTATQVTETLIGVKEIQKILKRDYINVSISRISITQYHLTGITTKDYIQYNDDTNYSIKYEWRDEKEDAQYTDIIKEMNSLKIIGDYYEFIINSENSFLQLEEISVIGKSDIIIVPKNLKNLSCLVSFELKKKPFSSLNQRQFYLTHTCLQGTTSYNLLSIASDLNEYWELAWSTTKTSLKINICRIYDTTLIIKAIQIAIDNADDERSLTELFLEKKIIRTHKYKAQEHKTTQQYEEESDDENEDEDDEPPTKKHKKATLPKKPSPKSSKKKSSSSRTKQTTKSHMVTEASDIANLDDLDDIIPTKKDYIAFHVFREMQKIKALQDYNKKKEQEELFN